jgi:HD-GYP domain-containing protein (c-di-GMP phosphodiesterase class II)
VSFVRRWLLVACLLLVPMAVLAILRSSPGIDLQWFSPDGHLVVVGGIALCALIVACVAVSAALRQPQPGLVWLGLGCSSVGLFMLGHGLTTPGVLGQPQNLWIARLPYAAIGMFAICLFVAGRNPDRGLNAFVARHPLAVIVGPIGAMGVFTGIVVTDPIRLHGATPFAHENDVFALVSTAIVLLLLVVVWRHGRRWHLGHDTMQLALLLAATMSIAAVFAFEHGHFARLSWWDYHAYLLAGFGAAVYAVLHKGRQQHELADVLATAFVDDPFTHIVQGYPEALSTLVRAVEMKDAYTHGHSQRTAELAVELGLRMGLPPDRLRVIARGAYLHDLGKIAIPDHILNKPGALTPEERRVVETHPQLGYELASNAPSLKEVLPIILHHHERVDGNGYPRGLAGSAVPLEARVVAVADVWDALTSDRSYRPGWAPAVALAHIQAGRGSHFDPVVVEALVRWAADLDIRASVEHGRADEAWKAAETCHQIDREPALV